MALKDKIKSNPRIKRLAIWMGTSSNGLRPRWWVRNLVNPFYHKRGRNTIIFPRCRLDLLPFNHFSMGNNTTLEDFTIVNNGVGAVVLGNNVFIGASNVIIGPVTIHDDVILAQHVVMSGLNHGFKEVSTPFCRQPVTTAEIVIGEGCWIGANAVITAGVRVGKFSIVAAGSVVTKNVPEYTIVGGNPARILKQFNHQTKDWEKPI